mmetsp:Transcript_6100/g.18405  ORF Transcript_6100/g.18405 Transcript_6100/m.18405 type:complete len:318 (-) Transcript_6100:712-1665(-)
MNQGGAAGRKTPYRRSTGQKAGFGWTEKAWKGREAWSQAAEEEEEQRRALEIRYINLEARVERRVEMEARLRDAGLEACATRFRALTGGEAPETVVARVWDSRLNSRYDKTTLPHPRVPMTSGERGCAMSHACVWASCARRPLDSWPLVVLEDDVEFAPDVAIHLARVVAKVEETFDDPRDRTLIVYLGADVASWAAEPLNASHRKHRLKAEAAAFFDIRSKPKTIKLLAANYVWQTSSYVLWPAAAKLLVNNFPISEPVDNFISRLLLHGRIQALVALPFLCRQVAAYCNGDILHSRPALACPDGDPLTTPLAPIW